MINNNLLDQYKYNDYIINKSQDNLLNSKTNLNKIDNLNII